jgi:acid phosphatase family membrane protein YuiD
MIWQQLIHNKVLIAGMIAWFLAQIIKVPVFYMLHRRWNWALVLSPGGMPSSHSALVTSATVATGIYGGFDTPLFGFAVAISMIVVYDAAGIRRQAGFHAQKINQLINELFSGHPISDKMLKEVLGHSPRQVFVGVLLGIVVALGVWAFWR